MSVISSSPSVKTGDVNFGNGMSATVPGVDADAPPPATAKDIPAIPSAGTYLLRRFPFEECFTRDIAEFLLLLQLFSSICPKVRSNTVRAL
jgi:hypothetical protein